MRKYVTVKAEFILPLSDDFDHKLYPNMFDELKGRIYAEFEEDDVKDIRVHLQPMPPEYNRMMNESDQAKLAIEADADRGISLGDALMGGSPTIRHPYEDGVWIFPDDHPLAGAERAAAAKGDTEVLNELQAAAPKLKELPRGSE